MAGDEDQKLLEQNKSSNSFKTSEPWENSNHSLFLHHSDQPGAVLVSQSMMKDNYTTWVQSMSMALTIKNKKGFVDGTLKRPTHNPDEQQQWDCCDILVKTWLLGAMSKDILGSVIHCKDTRSIWLELKERFSQTNVVSLFHIENVIHDCEQSTNSVTSFFTKLKSCGMRRMPSVHSLLAIVRQLPRLRFSWKHKRPWSSWWGLTKAMHRPEAI
jgi:hypothetical protein